MVFRIAFPTRSVIVNGKLSSNGGAVSMDLTTIDVTASPEVKVGDAVTLLGAEGEVSIDAQEIAKLAGTISYSVLCGIHARVKTNLHLASSPLRSTIRK